MLNKILLALGVVLTISALGSALSCNQCSYSSQMPKPQQKCDSRSTVTCLSGTTSCYTTTYTTDAGVVNVKRGCDDSSGHFGGKYCPDAAATCSEMTKKEKLRSCIGVCCTTDNCNDFTPGNGASGFMMTKFILGFMVIVGFLFA